MSDWFHEVLDAIGFMTCFLLATLFIGCALILGPIIALNSYYTSISCEATAAQMGVKHHWDFWTGCMIEADGRMEPFDWQKSVRVRQ